MPDKPGITIETVAQASKPAQREGSLPFYLFEVYDDKDTLVSEADLGGELPAVLLRIPPSSIRISAPIRAQIDLDLLGGISVAQGGLGLRRWSIGGTHGVGPEVILRGAFGGATVSQGYAARQALSGLFEAWATANENRRKEKKKPLKMLFAVRHGSFSEFQNEEWWIQPDGLPDDQRNSSRPLSWEWNLSFLALHRRREDQTKGSYTVLMPPSARDVQASLDNASSTMDGLLDKIQKGRLQPLIENAKKIKANLEEIRGRVSAAVSLYRNVVSGVSGFVRSCSRLIQDTLLMVNRSNLYDQPSREIFNGLREVQTAIGYAKMLEQGYLAPFSASTVSPPRTTLQTGDTLQTIAAKELGDSSRWRELAELNGLTYPYIDFSDGGAPDSQFLISGKRVLGEGDALKLPNQTGDVVPDDPVGTDMPDSGDLGRVVAGVDNLRESLLRRLRTPKGWLPHHPEYGSGLRDLIGRPLTPAIVLAARAEAYRVAMADPRVISVQSIGVAVEMDLIRIEASVVSVLGPVTLSGTVGLQAPDFRFEPIPV